MLKGMSDGNLGRAGIVVLALCAALPALADTQFSIRKTTRNEVPPGMGRCDIRLQVDNEVEVSVRRNTVSIRTIAGRDARDDGSECSASLPGRNLEGFNFQAIDGGNEIRLVAEPSPRNDFTAVVHIRNSGGAGRYHFRLSWVIGGGGGPTVERRGGLLRRSEEIQTVQVNLGNDVLRAEVDGDSVRCTIGHSSAGIRIRSEQVDMAVWLKRLLGALEAEAAQSEATRQALEKIMIGGDR